MNRKIVKLNNSQISDFVDINIRAYPVVFAGPSFNRDEVYERNCKTQTEDDNANLYGLIENEKLLGGMILYDFIVNYSGEDIPVAGIGAVSVDLLHKKEKVCKDMVEFFLKAYKERGYAIAMLYPFSPEFYKKMGFGYGTKMNQYRINPSGLCCSGSKEHIIYLKEEHKPQMVECFNRYRAKTHGAAKKINNDLNLLFMPNRTVIGYVKDGVVYGYAIMRFEPSKHASFLIYDLIIEELIYENAEVFGEIATFLNSQADQIRSIVYNTQEENFHFALADVRNGSPDLIRPCYHESNVSGVGLMYRVIDVKGVFETLKFHDFGGQNAKIRFNISDSLLQKNVNDVVICFNKGKALISEELDYDAEVAMDISEFSSLIMGAVNFKSLYRYGLASISDSNYVDIIEKIFKIEQKPMCASRF
ncbi:MAG: GNAT family N-acetyltransferase [Defluviitaleaceae bacterium]|nr:GNAT family N-acetyltransferase [Defluviitaleaceae bacterium]